MWQSLPEFGTGVLYAILVVAGYTFAVSLLAGQGRPRLLQSARLGAYATSALVLLGVSLLAYAFLTHDFRIRYVARYSDRSMSTTYLLTSLWGGQDGSLLWWLLLLSLYIAGCVRWLEGRYRELQPYVIATLMIIVGFFAILMIFAANPFQTSMAGARVDGEGLNPLLQNYWMIIHPPALYMGFVGCAIPFSFAVAALVTGRLDSEWIIAVRKWMLFAWMFLSIGNVLGMAWAYEELGWGGFWAWDPVENAACLPWFTASAYVHSTMIQERRGMLKTWNLFLICMTFFLTIFGTFLTRSGLIASVHSFAQSNIGIFFVYFMGIVAAASLALIVWRLPLLRAPAQIEAVASREAMFVVNNWALLGVMTFIAVATLFPKLSEWWWDETVTVGPPFFNRWLAPGGVTIFALMGLAPLFGWRKTSESALRRAFIAPLAAFFSMGILHLLVGKSLGFPAIVDNDQFYPGVLGVALQKLGSVLPLLVVSLAAFNVTVIVQEFVRGVQARQAAARRRHAVVRGDAPDSDRESGDAYRAGSKKRVTVEERGEEEGVFVALFRLLQKNRRRYGGYIVHLGIVSMFIGFVGTAWQVNAEASLMPGQEHSVGRYTLKYIGPRMDLDDNKRMVFADLEVVRDGKSLGRISPAKFIYKRMPESPTTEVAMLRGLRDDLYVVLGTANPQTKRASFQFHVNPLVGWIWIGLLILIGGAAVSLWPDISLSEVGVWAYVRTGATATAGVALSVWFAMSPTTALAAPKPARGPPVAEQPMGSELGGAGRWALGLAPIAGIVLGGVVGRRRRRDDSPR